MTSTYQHVQIYDNITTNESSNNAAAFVITFRDGNSVNSRLTTFAKGLECDIEYCNKRTEI